MKNKKRAVKPATKDTRIFVRVSEREKAAFQQAARRQGLSLSTWLLLAAHLVINQKDGKVELLTVE